MEYLAWRADPTQGFCSLKYLENVDDSYELKRGISRSAGFPADACFHMDPAHPKQIRLGDQLYNLDGLVVVSAAVREFIEARQPPHTEFLPVTVFNHKGRPVEDEYFVVNPLAVPDCIDKQNSTIEWNDIDPELICSCFDLVLLPDQIDDDLLLFRPKHMPTIVMVREDLAEAMTDAGFTGMWLVPTDEFEL
jgi:hypothetical protein